MNIYNINDESFKNSTLYKNFIDDNPVNGSIRVRAYAASGAVPISGVIIKIQTIYKNSIIVFYEGITDESGITPKIVLPAPRLGDDNLEAPNKLTYDVIAKYPKDKFDATYKVNIYEDICVVQNINIVPREEGEL